VRDTVYDFTGTLPMGLTTAASPTTVYRQPDHLTCFYASLAGIATAQHGQHLDVERIGALASNEGLLVEDGAYTLSDEARKRQVDFVGKHMAININFVDQSIRQGATRLHVLTHGLRGGNPVVFGLQNHWVALDGFLKWGRDRDEVTWTGMNPAPGKRIEQDPVERRLSPKVILDRLLVANKPVVVVENAVPPRFAGRGVADIPRFRPADQPVSTRPRFKRADT